MRAYFADLLEKFQSPDFARAVCKKYHYREEDLESLCGVAKAMLSTLGKEAGWEHRLVFAEDHWETETAMTLGEGIDTLQEHYLSQGLLSEGYMVEVLAGELLLQGYGAYNRAVEQETSYHVKRYHFPGSGEKYPIESLEALLERLGMPVRCNAAFCMIPKKSVAFTAELTREANVRCQGICMGCSSLSCPNRVGEIFH